MRLWKIIATASAVELAVCAGGASILGLGGAWSGWLDLLNHLEPLWFALCILAAPTAALLMDRGPARRAVAGLAILGAAVSGALVLPEMAASLGPFGRGGAHPLKIVTFNTWSNNQDPEAIVATIRAANPDAFALIEMDEPFHHSGIKAFARDYPYRTVPKGDCPDDIQVFSKRPFSAYGCQVTYDSAYPGVTEAIVWGRTTAPDGRSFTFAATHYAWPFPGDGQRMQMAALARWTKAQGDRNLILVGDFNLTPWSFSLRRQDRLLRPLKRQDHAIFTWPAMIARLHKPAPFAVLPIDHIYAGEAWRALRLRRLPLAGSDHYGVEATFQR